MAVVVTPGKGKNPALREADVKEKDKFDYEITVPKGTKVKISYE